jgi:cytochrome c
MKTILAASFGVFIPLSQPAFAEGDAVKGATVVKKCLACHAATETRNKSGPHLVGVIGRAVASVTDFKYSKDMKSFATAAGLWAEATYQGYAHHGQ